MKTSLICKFFFDIFNEYANNFKKNTASFKKCRCFYHLLSMQNCDVFLINSVKNDLKNFQKKAKLFLFF